MTERDNIYSVFDINGLRFGLFAHQAVEETHVFESNCLPIISVDNIEILMCFHADRLAAVTRKTAGPAPLD